MQILKWETSKVGCLPGGTFWTKVQGGPLTHVEHNIPILNRQKTEFGKEIICIFLLYVYHKTGQRMPKR